MDDSGGTVTPVVSSQNRQPRTGSSDACEVEVHTEACRCRGRLGHKKVYARACDVVQQAPRVEDPSTVRGPIGARVKSVLV